MEKQQLSSELKEAISKSIEGISSANNKLRGGPSTEMTWINHPKTEGAATDTDIQKRGFTYPGDSNQNWGLNGQGFDYNCSPFFGRFPGYFGSNINGFGGYSKSFTPLNGSINGTTIRLSNMTSAARWKMGLAVEAYKGFGIIKNVIDLMCNFASEGISIVHPRPAIKKFYERWAEKVDLEGRVKDILRYYYKFGNVFIYTTYGQLDNSAYTAMRTARAASEQDMPTYTDIKEENDKVEEINGKKLIPWQYTLLNPFQMDLKGTKFFGEQQWVFVVDNETINQLDKATRVEENNYEVSDSTDYVEFLDETEVNIPAEFKKLIDGRIVKLDQSKLWCMHYMKDDHEEWADPMIWPVINDVHYKQKLRSMDMSVCDSVINAVTVFKIGDIQNGFVAPQEHYDKLAEMLRTPTAAMTMVWNDALEIESNYPPVEKILGIQKYESVDRDILAGLGISEVIVNGRGGNYANSFLSVRTLLERLEEGRREVMKWINVQLRLIAEIMGHRDVPTVKFGQMSLRDEQAEKQLVVGLLDRNVISVESAHEILGFDYKVERERLKSEQSVREEFDIFIKHGPFIDPMSDMNETEKQDRQDERIDKQGEMNMEIEQEKMKVQQQKISGRPPGVKTPHAVKRDTKPQGMAFVNAMKRFTEIEAVLIQKVGAKYKKALTKEKRAALDNLAFMTFSRISLDSPATDKVVADILSASSPKASVLNTAIEMINDFTSSYGREPDSQELRLIKVTARVQDELNENMQ